MRAIILAGGHATRLWPVTKKRAKPLLPLAGKPILSHILDDLEEMDEVEKIYVTTNQKFEEEFRAFLSSRSDKNELIIEEQESEEEKLGALWGIINVIKSRGEDDYLVIGGDNYYSFDLRDFIEFSKEKNATTNACYELEDMEEAKSYGIAVFDENRKMKEFQEKPESPESKTASTACYFFPEDQLEMIDEYQNYWEGRLPRKEYLDTPGRLLDWAVDRYDCYAYPFSGRWMDIGTRKGYLRATRELEEGNRIEGSVENSDIGENVTILGGSRVENSEVENSIVLSDSLLKDSIIKDSVVGSNTKIEGKDLRGAVVKKVDR